MMTIIIGGSGSGKSAYAEEYIALRSGGMPMYYFATMQVFDEEGRKKAERHQKLRAGRGFLTVEEPRFPGRAADLLAAGEKAVLLECMSNLVANAMFSEETPRSAAEVAEEILRETERLKAAVSCLVIVTNNVFEDGIVYDETTTEYIRALGKINEMIAGAAEEVIEVVAGIPVFLRKR